MMVKSPIQNFQLLLDVKNLTTLCDTGVVKTIELSPLKHWRENTMFASNYLSSVSKFKSNKTPNDFDYYCCRIIKVIFEKLY